MKNQYFGDIGDYVKYAVLRRIETLGLRVGVIWMLTPNDDSRDGRRREYFGFPDANRPLDPKLFEALRSWEEKGLRDVRAIERSGLLGAAFFSEYFEDDASARALTMERAIERMQGVDVVFLDPDNGLQIKSCRYGSARSSKFVFWSELKTLWENGHSIVVYQHLTRVNRPVYFAARAQEFADALGVDRILLIKSVGNLFFGAIQPSHATAFDRLAVELSGVGDPRLRAEVVDIEPHLAEFRRARTRFQAETRELVREREVKTGVVVSRNGTYWTTPGAVNPKGQTVVRDSGIRNRHSQRVFVLRCGQCAYEYGAQGCDVFLRKCPRCQDGKAGEAME
ncbi:MAG: hypothetical protein ACYC7A_18035 [Thermoanaerobaculia bacterium]